MGKVSPLGAGLEGFRLMARRPGVALVWLLFFGVIAGVAELAGYVAAMSIPPIYYEWRALLVLAIVTPVFLFGAVVVSAAVYRALLEPRDKAVAFLRFGADEARLFAAALMLALAFLVLYCLAAVGWLAAAPFLRNTRFDTTVLGAGYGIVAAVALLLVFVRASLALVMTFAEKRIRIFDSWSLTRGAFWRLFVLFTALLVFVTALAAVTWLAQWRIDHLIGLATRIPWGGVDPAPKGPPVWPGWAGKTLLVVLAAVQIVLETVVVSAAQASAYRSIVGTLGEDAASVF